ncbi:hypothetical protein CEXT_554451 [Caerostris extrusa]|uniref:Uncharacterized protein n=1 Tax=Caerostris extrusa TaxID=172846 RepID=A0AAV4NIP9_CAEEX|nr:hypothetical protein CEXT_554451 [Caerostris extrusa]
MEFKTRWVISRCSSGYVLKYFPPDSFQFSSQLISLIPLIEKSATTLFFFNKRNTKTTKLLRVLKDSDDEKIAVTPNKTKSLISCTFELIIIELIIIKRFEMAYVKVKLHGSSFMSCENVAFELEENYIST